MVQSLINQDHFKSYKQNLCFLVFCFSHHLKPKQFPLCIVIIIVGFVKLSLKWTCSVQERDGPSNIVLLERVRGLAREWERTNKTKCEREITLRSLQYWRPAHFYFDFNL